MQDEMTREARLQALTIAVEQIEKQHGKGAVMTPWRRADRENRLHLDKFAFA